MEKNAKTTRRKKMVDTLSGTKKGKQPSNAESRGEHGEAMPGHANQKDTGESDRDRRSPQHTVNPKKVWGKLQGRGTNHNPRSQPQKDHKRWGSFKKPALPEAPKKTQVPANKKKSGENGGTERFLET